MSAGAPALPWTDPLLIAAMFAVDPAGVGGVGLRALPGPVRNAWLVSVRELLPPESPMRRIPHGVPDDRLLGGLDLAATLDSGRPVATRGILAEANGGVVVLAMAERLSQALAARICGAMDRSMVSVARDGVAMDHVARFGVIALDEGMSDEERPPGALLDRLAFLVDLNGIGPRAVVAGGPGSGQIEAARARLPAVAVDAAIVEALCGAAGALGVASIRAPLLALRVARIAAALSGREAVTAEDAALAARLVLAPRATVLPAADTPASQPPPGDDVDQSPEPLEPDDAIQPGADQQSADDMVLAAARAAIPHDLLSRLSEGPPTRIPGGAGRAGTVRASAARGRPAGVRAGEPRRGARLNVIETLRAAALWQIQRRRNLAAGDTRRILIRREDFRITRYDQRSETTIIFVVDASRSSAVNRLAEAKGAVELLLADCYVRRDRVAVLAFRGPGAELLLPPTRSLVRAKRELAGLPGGGGTPLAAGIKAAAMLAEAARRRGETPTIVLLTDGRANIALDGTAGRERAEDDARATGRLVRAAGITALLVDTAPRPQILAQQFAREMGARYLPLPYADATTLSGAVRSTTRPP